MYSMKEVSQLIDELEKDQFITEDEAEGLRIGDLEIGGDVIFELWDSEVINKEEYNLMRTYLGIGN